MIKKKKLLICALLMSMVVSFMPGMESNAAELSGEDQVTATLQDENSQRLEETTAMDEDGAIYEIHEEKGIVAEGTPSQNAMFLAKTSGQSKVVNFNTKGSAVTSFTYGGGSGYDLHYCRRRPVPEKICGRRPGGGSRSVPHGKEIRACDSVY